MSTGSPSPPPHDPRDYHGFSPLTAGGSTPGAFCTNSTGVDPVFRVGQRLSERGRPAGLPEELRGGVRGRVPSTPRRGPTLQTTVGSCCCPSGTSSCRPSLLRQKAGPKGGVAWSGTGGVAVAPDTFPVAQHRGPDDQPTQGQDRQQVEAAQEAMGQRVDGYLPTRGRLRSPPTRNAGRRVRWMRPARRPSRQTPGRRGSAAPEARVPAAPPAGHARPRPAPPRPCCGPSHRRSEPSFSRIAKSARVNGLECGPRARGAVRGAWGKSSAVAPGVGTIQTSSSVNSGIRSWMIRPDGVRLMRQSPHETDPRTAAADVGWNRRSRCHLTN